MNERESLAELVRVVRGMPRFSGNPTNQNLDAALAAARAVLAQPAPEREIYARGKSSAKKITTMLSQIVQSPGLRMFDADICAHIRDLCADVDAAFDAAPPAPAPAPAQPTRCHLCDNTGDIHDATGEWRGECPYCKAQPELSDEQIDAIFEKWAGANDNGVPYLRCYRSQFRDISRAVIAADRALKGRR